MLGKRAFSSVLLIGLVALLVWLEWFWGIALLAIGVAVVAQWEFYTLQEAKGLKMFKKAGVAAGLIFLSASALPAFGVTVAPRVVPAIESLAILAVILAVISRQVFEKNQTSPVATVALTLFGFIYVPFLFAYLIKIMFQPPVDPVEGVWMAVFIVAVTKVTDIGAYVVGSLVGRHPMSPTISPKKTWEGFAGGLAAALAVSLTLAHVVPVEQPVFQGIHPWLLGLSLSLFSVVGDLAESVIKRDARIKDSGGLIPGIGGCLDLIDSLLFTAPFFYAYLFFVIGT